MTASERTNRTTEADRVCLEAYDATGGPETGVALVAVGGYGRGELAPHSDWDVVLVHDAGIDPGIIDGPDGLATRLWYPLWDAASRLDHSVRSLPEMLDAADADLRVALGLLDTRHLAGDPNLTLRLRTTLLTHWRRRARERLPELKELIGRRHQAMGELAHAAIPDLKEAAGGLRDATILKALVATWLVDVPHADLERCRQPLLDVRDLVQEIAGRAVDRIDPETWPELAERLDLPDTRAAQVHVRELGRRLTHLSRLVWRRVDAALERSPSARPRRPQLTPIAPGIALSSGEVVLDRGARPGEDPLLLLRAAALAAERGVVLAPPTAARLARECAALPDPWPHEARHLLVRLLGAGRGLLLVWETLEETGALHRILPEWERIRLLPHASIIHRFTVDRHVVETCIEASALLAAVARPDVLLVTALLHDIGKGSLTEHSVAGAPIARDIARRMGFDADTADLVGHLVRWHLLLTTTATTRNPDDPATVNLIVSTLRDAEALSLLAALAEADARATSPKAWSTWRAQLVGELVDRARRVLDTGVAASEQPPRAVEIPDVVRHGQVAIGVEPVSDGLRVRVIATDRLGLLADLAATFALQRIPVRACRAWPQGPYAVSVWDIGEREVDPALLRIRFEAIVAGRVDAAARLRPPATGAEPSVVVRPEASRQATVLEIRTHDRPGILYVVGAALARLGLTVRSAHVDTLGPQAVDVFYVQEEHAGPLTDQRAADAAHAVRAALTGSRG